MDKIEIYPNPSSGLYKISGLEPGINLTIINNNGEIIKRIQSSSASIELDITDKPSGVYVVRVQSENKVRILRFIKL